MYKVGLVAFPRMLRNIFDRACEQYSQMYCEVVDFNTEDISDLNKNLDALVIYGKERTKHSGIHFLAEKIPVLVLNGIQKYANKGIIFFDTKTSTADSILNFLLEESKRRGK